MPHCGTSCSLASITVRIQLVHCGKSCSLASITVRIQLVHCGKSCSLGLLTACSCEPAGHPSLPTNYFSVVNLLHGTIACTLFLWLRGYQLQNDNWSASHGTTTLLWSVTIRHYHSHGDCPPFAVVNYLLVFDSHLSQASLWSSQVHQLTFCAHSTNQKLVISITLENVSTKPIYMYLCASTVVMVE